MSPEAAVVLGLQNRDGTTQEIASMILLPTDPGNRKDETGEMLQRIRQVCA
jgi:hypothetical protein